MTLDALVLWIFVASVLAGIGVTVEAVFVLPGLPKLLEDLRRRRRRPPGEPRPLWRGRSS